MLSLALASISRQSKQSPCEIIVSDDTGDEKVKELVDSHRDALAPHQVMYRDVSDGATGTAGWTRNGGAAHANGTWIAFLDDDDELTYDYLSHVQDTIAIRGQAKDLIVVGSEMFRENEVIRSQVPVVPARLGEYLIGGRGFYGSTIIVSRPIFDRTGGFDSALPVGNDIDFWYRAATLARGVVVIPDILVRRRVHGAGQLSTPNEQNRRGHEVFLRKHRKHMPRAAVRREKRYIARVDVALAPAVANRLTSLTRFVYYSNVTDLWRTAMRRVKGSARGY